MIRQIQPSHWVSDKDVKACGACLDEFTVRKRKHHCRNCGQIFCADCTSRRLTLINLGLKVPSRICEGCYTQLTNDDKRQIVEDLDAKDMMIASLKRALHQKVVLLDEVKNILSQLVESSRGCQGRLSSATEAHEVLDDVASRQEDEDDVHSDEGDGEDESVESHLKHLKETFVRLSQEFEASIETRTRMEQVKDHLEEELAHRDVHLMRLKEEHQKEVKQYRNEIERLALQVQIKRESTEDLETSAESAVSPSRSQPTTRRRSLCESLSEVVCWPVQAMYDVLHRRSSPRVMFQTHVLPPSIIGDADSEEHWRRTSLHSPTTRGSCCARRRHSLREPPGTSLLNDTLL